MLQSRIGVIVVNLRPHIHGSPLQLLLEQQQWWTLRNLWKDSGVGVSWNLRNSILKGSGVGVSTLDRNGGASQT